MESYFLVKLLHVLLFVYWLGGDIGVFYSANFVRNAAVPIEGRRVARQILLWVDMLPRYCLVLMLPVGYTLATKLGVTSFDPAELPWIWLIGLAWLAMVATIHYRAGTRLGDVLRRIDLGWRCILVPGLLWDAWQGFHGTGHILAPWLSAKFVVFAVLIFCGIMIRVLGAPNVAAFRQIFTTGSTPELEAIVTRTARRTRPFVLAIWVGLVIAAYIGIAKPSFGVN